MYLFFDTETTGIPRNYKAPVSDLRNWPRMVQLAWLLADEEANKWPTLQELYMKLFSERLEGAHRALIDVRACARCYFELRRLKVMA